MPGCGRLRHNLFLDSHQHGMCGNARWLVERDWLHIQCIFVQGWTIVLEKLTKLQLTELHAAVVLALREHTTTFRRSNSSFVVRKVNREQAKVPEKLLERLECRTVLCLLPRNFFEIFGWNKCILVRFWRCFEPNSDAHYYRPTSTHILLGRSGLQSNLVLVHWLTQSEPYDYEYESTTII